MVSPSAIAQCSQSIFGKMAGFSWRDDGGIEVTADKLHVLLLAVSYQFLQSIFHRFVMLQSFKHFQFYVLVLYICFALPILKP